MVASRSKFLLKRAIAATPPKKIKVKILQVRRPLNFLPTASIFLLKIGAVIIKRAEETMRVALYHQAGRP